MKNIVVDFSKISGPIYSGRKRGAAARERFRLDALDMDPNVIIDVIIPDATYTVTNSFFLGMFDSSIQKAGTREAFLKKFRFHTPSYLNETIEFCITRALMFKTYE